MYCGVFPPPSWFPQEPEEAPSPRRGLFLFDPLDALTNVAFRSKPDIGQPLATNLNSELSAACRKAGTRYFHALWVPLALSTESNLLN